MELELEVEAQDLLQLLIKLSKHHLLEDRVSYSLVVGPAGQGLEPLAIPDNDVHVGMVEEEMLQELVAVEVVVAADKAAEFTIVR